MIMEQIETVVITIATDLGENLARGDASLVDFTRQADEYAARKGLDLPPSAASVEVLRNPTEVIDPILALDLATAGISTIIWANGFRYDLNWIELPVFADETQSSDRVPVHKRGITAVPGVYFRHQLTFSPSSTSRPLSSSRTLQEGPTPCMRGRRAP